RRAAGADEAGDRGPGTAGARGSTSPRAEPALGRPAATGRCRPGDRDGPGAHPRGRADGQPRHRLGARRPRGPSRAPLHGPHHRADHPQRGGRDRRDAPGPHPGRAADRRLDGRVNLLELLRLAVSRLRTSRLRAALTMLGVVIGVASVVALVGVGQGTTANITTRLASLGTNLLTISPTGRSTSGQTLTLEDAVAIAKVDGVAAVAPELQTSTSIVVGTKSTTTSVVGTSADYARVRAYDVWQGSFLTDAAVQRGLRVAVLGATTASDLGLDAASIGSSISIGGLP